MTTDRPDTTESPFTVDAGRVQVETNLFGYARSRPDEDGAVTDSYELVNTNVRIGLTSDTEIGFVWQPYGIVRTRQADPVTRFRNHGIGGLDIRGKVNLWGNDAFDKPGATALALLPFVTLPTDDDNGISPEFVEGGLIVPLAIKLCRASFGLGLNAGVPAPQGRRRVRLSRRVPGHGVARPTSGPTQLGTYYEVARPNSATRAATSSCSAPASPTRSAPTCSSMPASTSASPAPPTASIRSSACRRASRGRSPDAAHFPETTIMQANRRAQQACCRLIAGAAALAIAALGLGAATMRKRKKPFRVVTTFTVIQDIAQNVAGTSAIVESITKPGAEIHDYQPTPLDIVKAQSADLVLWNGMNLERWFEKFFENVKDVPSVVVTEGIEPMGIKEGPYTGKPNPHAWMSPAQRARSTSRTSARRSPSTIRPTPRPTPRTPPPTPPRSRPSTSRCASASRPYPRRSAGSSRAKAPSATSPATTA